MVGNPEIRFQENEGVQKSIHNAIRYHADPDFKSQYHADLGESSEGGEIIANYQLSEEQIKAREEVERQERKTELSMSRQQEEEEGKQWGKPGPGGAYWRSSAITGQGFFDKMGWWVKWILL